MNYERSCPDVFNFNVYSGSEVLKNNRELIKTCKTRHNFTFEKLKVCSF